MDKTSFLLIFLIIYLCGMNLLGFGLMGSDKQKAIQGAWRISEATLFVVALLGGSIGCFAGMYYFHHKTKHPRFVIGIPVIFILQFLSAWYFIFGTFPLLAF